MEQWETDLVNQVSELARMKFVERAGASDLAGTLQQENIAELKALGIPGMGLAKSLGGLGIGAEAHIRIMEEIAYGDASTAVAVNMHILIADLLANFPPFGRRNEVLEEIGKQGALICGPGSVPTTELDNRKSGYQVREEGDELVVNGRSGFASGSDAATFVFVPGAVDRGEGNEPDLALVIPRIGTPGMTVLNNWDAMGLRGTASHDIVCEEMRVPKSEGIVVPAVMVRALQDAGGSGGIMQNRALGALGILAIWLGLAQHAMDFTVDYVAKRHGYLAGELSTLGKPPGYRADEAWAQMGIGDMDHWLGTGRVVLYDMVRSLDTPYPSAAEFTRAITRCVYHLRRMGEEVAAGAMRVCGAHAYTKNRDLERIFRDMIGGNVMAWKTDQLRQMLGMGALGMPITIAGPAGS
jgi:alkylation response protein AidB-like acyl-CoA dehydrogenase